MRTKTLIAAAALLAAGALSSMAQSNVYSVNVVGYVNLAVTNGFQLVANQLDLDGKGTNNTLYTSIGTNMPNLTRVYAFVPSSGAFPFASFTTASHTWVGTAPNIAAVNAALQPGGGVWLNYASGAGIGGTITLVGNVMQGGLTTPVYQSGYQLISSEVPQQGLVRTDLKLAPVNLDRIYQFAQPSGYGVAHTYIASSSTWANGEPTIGVGEAFWLQGHAGSAWTRNFTVQ